MSTSLKVKAELFRSSSHGKKFKVFKELRKSLV